MNKLVATNEYLSFRNAVPLKRVIVDEGDSKVWSLYDAGPKTVKCPIICLPPAAGKADVFYRQVLGLSGMGYRTIALDYPVYWTVEEFCVGLRKIIDHLHLDQIHIFGCSLGAYLGLKFAERMRNTPYIASIVLCNGFTDTSVFKYTRASSAFWLIPGFLLKRLVMGSFTRDVTDAPQADATDFVVECLENLTQQEIASRLVLHCNGDYVRKPHSLQHIAVTLMDVFDESALSQSVKDDMYKCFPNAKRAHLKTGGNFPYLSRSSEVNLHLRIHLKSFEGTKASAREAPSPHDATNLSPSMQAVPSDEIFQEENDDTKPKTLLDLSKLNKDSDDEMSMNEPPTIEVDDNEPIDFPI
uniref:maspardin-like n=1 Tax=Styela clava TaxID=7725 RepID=UPI001939D30F|nr:maspardin-like [Styela clava]